MLEFLVLIVSVWLMFKIIGLAFRVTWGLAKFAAMCLAILAFPALLVCLLTAGGLVLLLPLAMIVSSFGILSTCV